MMGDEFMGKYKFTKIIGIIYLLMWIYISILWMYSGDFIELFWAVFLNVGLSVVTIYASNEKIKNYKTEESKPVEKEEKEDSISARHSYVSVKTSAQPNVNNSKKNNGLIGMDKALYNDAVKFYGKSYSSKYEAKDLINKYMKDTKRK